MTQFPEFGPIPELSDHRVILIPYYLPLHQTPQRNSVNEVEQAFRRALWNSRNSILFQKFSDDECTLTHTLTPPPLSGWTARQAASPKCYVDAQEDRGPHKYPMLYRYVGR
jgi:hypothetical protein